MVGGLTGVIGRRGWLAVVRGWLAVVRGRLAVVRGRVAVADAPADRGAGTDRASRRRGSEAGVAVVEFVMISVLMVLLLFSVVQVAAVFYVRNIVAASAADAARYASASGVEASAGAQRANQLISDALSPSVGSDVPCASRAEVDAASGLRVVRVECAGRIRSLLLPLGVFVSIHVVARSLQEDP